MIDATCMRCGDFPAEENKALCIECGAIIIRQQLVDKSFEPLHSDVRWALDDLQTLGVPVETVTEGELWLPTWAVVVLRSKHVGKGMLSAALQRGVVNEEFRSRLTTVVRMGGDTAEYIIGELLEAGIGLRVAGYGEGTES